MYGCPIPKTSNGQSICFSVRVQKQNYRKLSELTAQIHKIGVLYNQTVRAINSYHSVKTAQIMLEKLENLSVQIIALQEQAISLTIDYRKK